MASYEQMYDIKDEDEFANTLKTIITIIKKLGATQQKIDEVIDLHISKWLKRQEDKREDVALPPYLRPTGEPEKHPYCKRCESFKTVEFFVGDYDSGYYCKGCDTKNFEWRCRPEK